MVEIVPEEDQVIGIRPFASLFGTKYTQIKAGARIAWNYALLVEVAATLFENRKVSQIHLGNSLYEQVKTWRNSAPRMPKV